MIMAVLVLTEATVLKEEENVKHRENTGGNKGRRKGGKY
jgi:hypothetical protein